MVGEKLALGDKYEGVSESMVGEGVLEGTRVEENTSLTNYGGGPRLITITTVRNLHSIPTRTCMLHHHPATFP